MIIKKFIKYLLIFIFNFFLFSMSFKTFLHNFDKHTLRSVFAFDAFVSFVGSVASSGSVASPVATSGSVASSGVGSPVGILSKIFLGNNLLLKLLRTFSLAVNYNPKLF